MKSGKDAPVWRPMLSLDTASWLLLLWTVRLYSPCLYTCHAEPVLSVYAPRETTVAGRSEILVRPRIETRSSTEETVFASTTVKRSSAATVIMTVLGMRLDLR